MSRRKALIEYVIPEGEPEGDFIAFYAKLGTMAAPLAFAISYARNGDAKWAAIHALLGVPYLAYVAVDAVSREEAEILIATAETLNAHRTH